VVFFQKDINYTKAAICNKKYKLILLFYFFALKKKLKNIHKKILYKKS